MKGSEGLKLVRRPNGQRYTTYTTVMVKHGGGNVLLWGCFSGHGIGPIHHINGIMGRFMYKNILQNDEKNRGLLITGLRHRESIGNCRSKN